MGEKKRLFLAVNLSVAVTRKIGEAIGKMRQAAERRGLRVGWVPPANLHVTLKYLGWSSAEVVEAVRDQVAALSSGLGAFELGARGTGGFPSETGARVLWVGVSDPAGVLGPLAERVDVAMAGLGYAREERPFHPHVTVGRVKEGKGTEEVLAPFRGVDFGSSTVRDIVLYESFTKASGSEYVAQFRHPLAIPERQTRMLERAQESEDPDGGKSA
jgi:2'-5' RNA ligase